MLSKSILTNQIAVTGILLPPFGPLVRLIQYRSKLHEMLLLSCMLYFLFVLLLLIDHRTSDVRNIQPHCPIFSNKQHAAISSNDIMIILMNDTLNIECHAVAS